jgi:hypothetical protein
MISFDLMLLVSKSLDCFIVHDAFILGELLFLVNFLSLSDLDNSLFALSSTELSVAPKGHKHVGEVERSTVELEHAAEKNEFEGDWAEEANCEAKTWLNGTNGSVDAKNNVLGRNLMERNVKEVKMLENRRTQLPDSLLNELGNNDHSCFLKDVCDNSDATKCHYSHGRRGEINGTCHRHSINDLLEDIWTRHSQAFAPQHHAHRGPEKRHALLGDEVGF